MHGASLSSSCRRQADDHAVAGGKPVDTSLSSSCHRGICRRFGSQLTVAFQQRGYACRPRKKSSSSVNRHLFPRTCRRNEVCFHEVGRRRKMAVLIWEEGAYLALVSLAKTMFALWANACITRTSQPVGRAIKPFGSPSTTLQKCLSGQRYTSMSRASRCSKERVSIT